MVQGITRWKEKYIANKKNLSPTEKISRAIFINSISKYVLFANQVKYIGQTVKTFTAQIKF